MPLALYRRYRPESYAEVIGQEHVTGPLQQALRNDRVHHAYLFSGPRGCGKTTSARILARCLNCEQGPTPQPCGVCDSCVALARGGPGSLDVIEIDAASHGGVDDARDLRERAFFAPASSRFKIYIVDEAHMVTTQGFNALLKLVEEPPEHVKFIFATTEPEKVIGTIRSRTHHYPFRLVPPGTLTGYLADLCLREGIAVEAAVLPLVVRAGEGSVRDSLSVLDQLLSGAGEAGVTYAMAAALLGYTDAALLDAVMDAFAASDGAAAFELIDRVVEAGHDPRRFVADLLDRVRDLMLVDAVPDAVAKGLVVGPPEEVAALAGQAARFGSAELVRAAEILNAGLTEMRGATAPRLQLELICARVLLPAVAADEIGLMARVDRLERRLAIAPVEAGTPTSSAADTSAAKTAASAPTAQTAASVPSAKFAAVAPPAQPVAVRDTSAATTTRSTAGQDATTGNGRSVRAEPVASSSPAADAPASPPVAASRVTSEKPVVAPRAAGLDIIEIRRQWPAVLDAVKSASKVTWMMMFEKVTVATVDAERLVLAFPDGGTLKGFMAGGRDTILRDAITRVLGLTLTVDGVLDSSRAAAAPTEAARPSVVAERSSWADSDADPEHAGSDSSIADSPAQPAAEQVHAAPGADEPAADHRMPRPRRATARGESAGRTAARARTGDNAQPFTPTVSVGDVPDPDSDPDAVDSGEAPADLLARTLGAVVVERVSDT